MVSVALLLYAAVGGVAFLIGVFGIPVYAYTAMGSVPLISPMFGKLTFTLGAMANGANVLNQRENGSYEILRADVDEWEPFANWTRLGMSRFGVSYERTEAAFGKVAADLDVEYLATESPERDDLAGQRHEVNINRGGLPTFVRTDIDPEAILVKAGEKISEMRNSAGIAISEKAQRAALKDHGGDSNEFSHTKMGAISLVFFVLSAAFGYVLMFGM